MARAVQDPLLKDLSAGGVELDRAGVGHAAWRLAMRYHHLKARKLGDPKGGRRRDVRWLATPSRDNAPDAGMLVARVYGVPWP